MLEPPVEDGMTQCKECGAFMPWGRVKPDDQWVVDGGLLRKLKAAAAKWERVEGLLRELASGKYPVQIYEWKGTRELTRIVRELERIGREESA